MYTQLVLLLASIVVAQPSGPDVEQHTLRLADGTDLQYSLVLPPGYDGSEAVPLVLALHWGWDHDEGKPPFYSTWFVETYAAPAFASLGAIVVAPDCPGDSWSDARTERALLALLHHVEASHAVDTTRRVITGYSMGGMGTWFMAARHADLFSAAVVVAGRPRPAWTEALQDIPLYVIHSRADEMLPIEPTREAIASLRARSYDVVYVEVDGVGHDEADKMIGPARQAAAWVTDTWARSLK